jgi:hypothetical protein
LDLCRGYITRTETDVIRNSSQRDAHGSLQQRVVAIGGQTRLIVSGQELQPRGAMRQQAASKDMNMETEESTLSWDPLPSNTGKDTAD